LPLSLLDQAHGVAAEHEMDGRLVAVEGLEEGLRGACGVVGLLAVL
jgi:hypothetical protein